MALYKPNDFVKYYRGKMNSTSDISFAKKKDTLYTMQRLNDRNLMKHPYTTNETKIKNIFKAARAAIKILTTQQKEAYRTAFAAQDKYGYLSGYIFAMEFAKAKAAAEGGGE